MSSLPKIAYTLPDGSVVKNLPDSTQIRVFPDGVAVVRGDELLSAGILPINSGSQRESPETTPPRVRREQG
ncbi:hypothetical protein HY407_01590 [Candidatus Gottesmanbacteria bacterium]|nr:hypothetical protein [Candidatus Gottesmanbacteria bacterium]